MDTTTTQPQAKKDWGTLNGQGGCHCGKLRYAVNGPMLNQSYCDCKACQKETGAMKAPFITVRGESVKILKGTPADFKSNSGWKCDCHGSWRYCPDCGTRIYWVNDDGKMVDILPGSLDDPTVFVLKD